MNPYQAYLFDLDGTLVDTAPDLMDALNHTLKTIELPPIDIDLTRRWIGFGGRVMLKQAMAALTKQAKEDVDIEHLYKCFVRFYENQTSQKSKPYPTVVSTLETLIAQQKRLAVVTNKAEHLAVKCLDELDLTRFFNVVVGGDTMQVAKPAAEPVLYACNELDVSISNTLFVGDSMTDLECARNAGCDVAILQEGYNGGVDPTTMGADAVIATFEELLE